jgi:hypothetical protein
LLGAAQTRENEKTKAQPRTKSKRKGVKR